MPRQTQSSSLTPTSGQPHIMDLTARVIIPDEKYDHRIACRVEFTGNKSRDRLAYQAAKHWLLLVHDLADVLPGPGLWDGKGPRTKDA